MTCLIFVANQISKCINNNRILLNVPNTFKAVLANILIDLLFVLFFFFFEELISLKYSVFKTNYSLLLLWVINYKYINIFFFISNTYYLCYLKYTILICFRRGRSFSDNTSRSIYVLQFFFITARSSFSDSFHCNVYSVCFEWKPRDYVLY